MTIIACLAVLSTLAAVLIQQHQHAKQQAAWVEERRELLTRIQRPDYLPMPAPENFVVPEMEPDDIDLVGVIQDPKEDE